MSTDPKSVKPIPSADEINAYLELSAARTKLRLPLAKGAASSGTGGAGAANPPAPVAKRPLPLSGSNKLPVLREASSAGEVGGGARDERPADESSEAVWRPFSNDD